MATVAESWLGTRSVERTTLQELMSVMTRAYMDGPWLLPPEELQRQIAELDRYALEDLLWSQG